MAENASFNFGRTVAALRVGRRMTQDELALAADASRSLIQSAEASAVPTMRAKNYRKLAKALGMTPEQLDEAWGRSPGPVVIPLQKASFGERFTALMVASVDARVGYLGAVKIHGEKLASPELRRAETAEADLAAFIDKRFPAAP